MSEKDFERNNLVSNKGGFEEKKDGFLTRRDFMISTAVVGAGAAALATLSSNEAAAQATKESAPAKTSGSMLWFSLRP